MSHIPLPAVVAVLVAYTVASALLIASTDAARRPGRRLGACLADGLLAGAALAAWVSARPAVHLATGHMSAANVRADAILGTAAAVTVILFAVVTAMTRRQARGRGRTPVPRPAASRRRAGASR
jgi:hypothetical protein